MTKHLLMLTALAVLTPIAAQAEPRTAPVQIDPKKSDADKVVCKREDTLGSRLNAKKVCMTVKEWQEYVYWNREQVERWQESAQAMMSH